jgi:hypothetical protein
VSANELSPTQIQQELDTSIHDTNYEIFDSSTSMPMQMSSMLDTTFVSVEIGILYAFNLTKKTNFKFNLPNQRLSPFIQVFLNGDEVGRTSTLSDATV